MWGSGSVRLRDCKSTRLTGLGAWGFRGSGLYRTRAWDYGLRARTSDIALEIWGFRLRPYDFGLRGSQLKN